MLIKKKEEERDDVYDELLTRHEGQAEVQSAVARAGKDDGDGNERHHLLPFLCPYRPPCLCSQLVDVMAQQCYAWNRPKKGGPSPPL